MEEVALHFNYSGKPISCEKFGNGHINKSLIVKTDTGHKYVLQRMNNVAFHDVPGLMSNVVAVSNHLEKKNPGQNSTISCTKADNGNYWYIDEEGKYWRSYEFIDDTICLELPETPEDFYETAIAFGTFQNQLDDFPVETLVETIPNFHNTPERFRQFHEAIEKDAAGRVKGVMQDIEMGLEREDFAPILVDMLKDGLLPLRVTHNDTKINNVLLNAKTRKAQCVIDLDTVMPGLSAYDFGEAVRTGASTADEDEQDLSKVSVNLDLYRIFARGFLKACPKLTENEKNVLHIGVKMMTLENAIRFLGDYLNGDIYYAIKYPEHNLVRARAQFKLVQDMEEKWEEMAQIIREESHR